MRRPFSAIIAISVAAIVSLTAIPLLAQTGDGLLEGAAAFDYWHADRPGTRRRIGPQDLPASDLAKSARNAVRTVQRTDQKPIVPNGFEVNLFASGLSGPRIIRTAPNGDVFVAESEAGRISVLRAIGRHHTRDVVFSPDGKTYVSVGSGSNVAENLEKLSGNELQNFATNRRTCRPANTTISPPVS